MTLHRKKALWCIQTNFRIMPDSLKKPLNLGILKDMIKLKLLERVSRDKIKIINRSKALNICNGLGNIE